MTRRRLPWAARHVLRLTLPRDWRDDIVRDLEEAYERRWTHGQRWASRLWLTWQVAVFSCRFAADGLLERLSSVEREAGSSSPRRSGPEPGARIGSAEQVASDLIMACRLALKRPGFSSAVVLTLALGIGGTTAAFSLYNGVVLRPLTYPESERLHVIFEQDSTGSRRLPSYPTFADWHEHADAFEGIAFIRGAPLNYRVDDGAGLLIGSFVSEDFFSVMGVSAALGRVLGGRDFSANASTAAVMSDLVWRRWFGAEASVIGSTMNVGGEVVTIVGIMPAAFRYPDWGVNTDIWIPISKLPAPDLASLMQRDFHADARVVARIRPDVQVSRAESQLRIIGSRLAAEYPETNAQWTRVALLPLQGVLIGDFRGQLLLLGGVVAAVLLICCLNLGNLFLVQGIARQREFAIRSALGAGRLRIGRQLVAESLVLTGLGGILGVLGAARAVGWARGGGLPGLPRADELNLDLTVLGVATATTLATALLFAAVGARVAGSAGIMKSGDLRSGSGTVAWKRLPLWVQSGQIALTFVLLLGSALLTQSLWQLSQVDPGFDPERLLTIRIHPPSPSYDEPEAATDLYARLVRSVREVSGVEGAALANHGPGSSAGMPTRAAIGGPPTGSQGDLAVSYRTVSADYFGVLGIPILSGREFTEDDLAGAPGPVIINVSLGARWGTESPLGGALGVLKGASSRRDFGQPLPGRVVGVVGDVNRAGQTDQEPPTVYVPYTHDPWEQVSIYARTNERDPSDILDRLRSSVLGVDPAIPTDGQFVGATTVAAQRSAATYAQRLNAALLGVFSAVGLLLATIGMYGVTAFTVAGETRALGVRLALGATASRVVQATVMRVAMTACIGLLFGGIAAVSAGALITERIGVLQTPDARMVFGTATILALVVGLAGYIPARRAGRVDPVVALRSE